MNDVLKTFGCVAAYAGGLVIGITATSMLVAKLEKKSISRNLEALTKDLNSNLPYVSNDLAAAMATSVANAKKAAKAA
jgi:hypothetical protein